MNHTKTSFRQRLRSALALVMAFALFVTVAPIGFAAAGAEAPVIEIPASETPAIIEDPEIEAPTIIEEPAIETPAIIEEPEIENPAIIEESAAEPSAAHSGAEAPVNSALLPNGGSSTALREAGEEGRAVTAFSDGWTFAWATPYTTFPDDVTETSARRRYLVNHGLPDPEGYLTEDLIRPDYNDDGWRTVRIPHDYAIEGERTGGVAGGVGMLNSGIGWYRKSFTAPDAIFANGERVVIDFEGVYHNSYVWLNGKLIGNYYNGYTGFAFDITDDIIYGGAENVLVVKINSASPSGRWYHGGGIIRPVNAIVKGAVSFNRHGVVLSSPNLKDSYQESGDATLGVIADISFSGDGEYDALLRVTAYDESGDVVNVIETDAGEAAGLENGTPEASETNEAPETNEAYGTPGTYGSLSASMTVPNVNLWYPWNLDEFGTPYLYDVKAELFAKPAGAPDGEYKLCDAIEQNYGFRWTELEETDLSDPSMGGFYINGQYTKLHGVNTHSDTGAMGAISNWDAYERQLELLMSMGVNFIRTAHNPVAKEYIELCNQLGLMVIEEAHDSWGEARATYDFGTFFWDEVPADWAGLAPNGYDGSNLAARLGVQYPGVKYTWGTWVAQEMTRRDVNEPSIVMWDIGNEVRQDRLGGAYTEADVAADNGTGDRVVPGYNLERGVVDWYDGTKYDDEAVTGLPSNTRNDGYDAYTVGNASVPGVQIDLYTEGVRLSEDVKAIDESRYVLQTSDNMRWPRADDPEDDWEYQYAGGDTSVYGRWGYISRYQRLMGLQYSASDSNDVLYNRFSGENFVAFFESETNAAGSNRGLYFAPRSVFSGQSQVPGYSGYSGYMNGTGAYWSGVPIISIKRDRDRKYFLGSTLWAGWDYLGEGGGKGSNSGAINTAGFFKDYYYMQKASWMPAEDEKFVHIMPMNWNDQVSGQPMDIRVYSNVQTVELFLNGESMGVKSFDVKETDYGMRYLETSNATRDDTSRSYWKEPMEPDPNPGGYISPAGAKVVEAAGDSEIPEGATFGDPYLTWKDFVFEPGVLEIKAYDSPAAYAADKEANVVAQDSVVTAGVPYAIEANAYKNKTVMKADGDSLIYVECDIIDENGNPVPNAKNLVKFSVTGAAVIAGADAGENNSYSMTSKWGGVQFNSQSQYHADTGKVLVILQSKAGETGDIQLTVSSDGLQPTVMNLSATADGTGEAPAQYTVSPALLGVSQAEFNIPVGVVPDLPKNATVNYSDAVAGSYQTTKTVVWDEIDPALFEKAGSFVTEGSIDGLEAKATAVVNVLDTLAKGDISSNAFDGEQIIDTVNQNAMYRWEDIPADHPIRDGALATSSFATGNPNATLQDNAANWQNTYNGGGNSYQLATRFYETVPYSDIEFYWDGARSFDKIDLTFIVTAPAAPIAGTDVPGKFTVQYWDGANWKDVANQAVTVPGEGEQRLVTLSFDPVYAARVRVGMENATPWTDRGGMRINRAVVTGWETDAVRSISATDDFNVWMTKEPTPDSGLFNPSFEVMNLSGKTSTVTVILAAYGVNGTLIGSQIIAKEIESDQSASFEGSLTPGEGVAQCKFFVWGDGYAPLTSITTA